MNGLRQADEDSGRAAAMLHAEFARAAGHELSELVQRPVSVSLRDAAVGTYGKFVFHQTLPTCCAVIHAEPIDSLLFLTIQPSILFPLLDLALGCGQPEPAAKRPLSEIETQITITILDRLLGRYRDAWQRALAMQLSVVRLEHNMQRMEALRGGDPAYLVRYELECAPNAGRMELCLPWRETERMRQRLAANDPTLAD